eukprot:7134128-Pyramimonas_sp.AAC.1
MQCLEYTGFACWVACYTAAYLRCAASSRMYTARHAYGKKTWLHRVLQDLQWVRTTNCRLRDMPGPAEDLQAWEVRILQSLPAWKKVLHATLAAHADAAA